MSNKYKELILKILIVLSLIFGGMPLILAVLSCFFYIPNLLTLIQFCIIVMLITGSLCIILMHVMKFKPEKPESYPISSQDFENFMIALERILKDNFYEYQKKIALIENAEIFLFCKKEKRRKLYCFSVIRVSELSGDIVELADEKITDFFRGYYGTDRVSDTIVLFSVVCVDRINSSFRTFVDNCGDVGKKRYMFPAGISFGGKKLYVVHLSSFVPEKYIKLKKDFLELMAPFRKG